MLISTKEIIIPIPVGRPFQKLTCHSCVAVDLSSFSNLSWGESVLRGGVFTRWSPWRRHKRQRDRQFSQSYTCIYVCARCVCMYIYSVYVTLVFYVLWCMQSALWMWWQRRRRRGVGCLMIDLRTNRLTQGKISLFSCLVGDVCQERHVSRCTQAFRDHIYTYNRCTQIHTFTKICRTGPFVHGWPLRRRFFRADTFQQDLPTLWYTKKAYA